MSLYRVAAASAALLALSACNAPASEPAAAPKEAPPAAAPATPAGPVLTPEGLGPIKIGMTEAEVIAAVGADRVVGDTGSDFEGCKEMQLKDDLVGTWVMFEEGKVTRVSIGDDGQGGVSTAKTDKGLGIGSTAAEVRAAYPALKSEPHKYEGPGAEYLTVWTTPDKAGINFETGENGKVKTIHGGAASIQYVEGCA